MKTAKEHLNEALAKSFSGTNTQEIYIMAINEARKEAIRECATKVTLEYRVYSKDGTTVGTDLGQEVTTEKENHYIGINAQSILNLIDQVK